MAHLPLNALRAFDAAARHLSFTHAAEELAVSQAAVSFQIRRLEERLGQPLFHRQVRAIELTEAGIRLHRGTRGVFQQLAAAVAEVSDQALRPLTIALTPSFASRWLFPRLGRFRERHPDHDVQLIPSIEPENFADGRVDLAIRWGQGPWLGLESIFLMKAPLTPVCSPRLIESGPALSRPADLAGHRLLHERDHQDWRWWMSAAGLDPENAERGLVLGDPSLLDHAAIAGEGVAVGRPALLRPLFERGLLVQPFDCFLPTTSAYHLVHRPGAMEDRRIDAFRRFLFDELAVDNPEAVVADSGESAGSS